MASCAHCPANLTRHRGPSNDLCDDCRFWQYVLKTETCWVWTGGENALGYGTFWDDKPHLAHRWAYQRRNGPIPDGLVLDHLCRNPSCVRPDHLEIVTTQANTLRGLGPSAVNAAKVMCLRGHPLEGDNVYLRSGRRHCRACNRIRTAEWAARRRAKAVTLCP